MLLTNQKSDLLQIAAWEYHVCHMKKIEVFHLQSSQPMTAIEVFYFMENK